MKKGWHLIKVELAYMPLKRWIYLLATACIAGISMGLIMPMLLENAMERSLHFLVGFFMFCLWFMYPTMVIRGDAYRTKDPHAKMVVPDIYILLQLMPLAHKEKAWNRLLSMLLFVLLFNGFAYAVAAVTMIIDGTISTIGLETLVYSAIGWLLLSSFSGLLFVISEPESRQYRHRDMGIFLMALLPFIAVFALIGWLTDLWFFGIFLEALCRCPLMTVVILAVLLIAGVRVSIKYLERTFAKVDYYV
ncbi:LOW QUALITY PROTEIN: hypothetical protein JCM19046_1329 [Bacillus sp. JCM 19046]|nr:LOW QUALITY PROTEIN: hypothetical protein JCM19046_1329 [Bacillus sp. JCM 19046]